MRRPDRLQISVPFERDQRAHRNVELAQLVGAAEVGQVANEAGGEHVGAELASSNCGGVGEAQGVAGMSRASPVRMRSAARE